MVLEGNTGDSRVELSCRGGKKRGKTSVWIIYLFKNKKQPKEKGHGKGTVVSLKTCPFTDIFSGISHITIPFW